MVRQSRASVPSHPPMIKRLFLNERFILALIVLNALAIFAQGFDRDGSPLSRWLEAFDQALTFLFVVEAAVKLAYFGGRAYFGNRWNVFDFTLVVLALPSLLVWTTGSSIDLDFLLVFRVLRIFKFFRVLRFIPNIEHLLRGVARAARSSVIIVFAFFIFNFIVSILSFSFYRELAPEYFSDPLLSLYSTFKVFTIEGWYEIPDLIAERGKPATALFTRIYFVLLLFGGGVIGLSLINSIFVDNMLSDNTEELEKQVERIEAKLDRLLEEREGAGSALQKKPD
jgi:voltage-gated sodium channel